MILKVIIFAIVALLIYKFFGGRIPSIPKRESRKKLNEETLIECEVCGTYATLKESIIVRQKYYCSQECIG